MMDVVEVWEVLQRAVDFLKAKEEPILKLLTAERAVHIARRHGEDFIPFMSLNRDEFFSEEFTQTLQYAARQVFGQYHSLIPNGGTVGVSLEIGLEDELGEDYSFLRMVLDHNGYISTLYFSREEEEVDFRTAEAIAADRRVKNEEAIAADLALVH